MTKKEINSELKIYKFRFVILSIVIACLLFLFLLMIRRTFSSYVSDTAIEISSNQAAYIFNEGKMTFNIDTNKIIPASSPYVYSFTISNYNDIRKSDVDINYTLSMRTTTNLPLRYSLYKDKNYNEIGSVNIIANTSQKQDQDGSWYNEMVINNNYDLLYTTSTTDTYYLVVEYPISYSSSLTYEGMMDLIEITINSKQIVE